MEEGNHANWEHEDWSGAELGTSARAIYTRRHLDQIHDAHWKHLLIQRLLKLSKGTCIFASCCECGPHGESCGGSVLSYVCSWETGSLTRRGIRT